MLRQVPIHVTRYVVWFPLVADAIFLAEMKIGMYYKKMHNIAQQYEQA